MVTISSRGPTNLSGVPDFVENVLCSFSCFYIEIAYSNFTFCDVYTLSFLACHTISGKRAHPCMSKTLTLSKTAFPLQPPGSIFREKIKCSTIAKGRSQLVLLTGRQRETQAGVCSFSLNLDSFQVNSQKLGSSGATKCGV